MSLPSRSYQSRVDDTNLCLKLVEIGLELIRDVCDGAHNQIYSVVNPVSLLSEHRGANLDMLNPLPVPPETADS